MLVITRRRRERIRLDLGDGRYVWIQLMDVNRSEATIGVEAPKEIAILREEIIEEYDHRQNTHL